MSQPLQNGSHILEGPLDYPITCDEIIGSSTSYAGKQRPCRLLHVFFLSWDKFFVVRTGLTACSQAQASAERLQDIGAPIPAI